MAIVPLGLITVTNAGTPQGLASTWTPCNSFFIQQVSTNTGSIYIGVSSTMNKTTLAGVIAVLPPPSGASLPAFSSSIITAVNPINLQDIYIDTDNNAESGLCSYSQD